MSKLNWKQLKEEAKYNEAKGLTEDLWAKRIVKYILRGLLIIFVIAFVFATGYTYQSLQPLARKDTQTQEVMIPIGSSNKEIAKLLEDHHLIRNSHIFHTYLKLKNITDLQAGYFDLSPSMNADQIVNQLQEGGRPITADTDVKLTVVEGMMLEEIAETVAQHTSITKEEFIKTADDPAFIKKLAQQFPSLIQPLMDKKDLKHPLEGYLYPATYDYFEDTPVEELISDMVAQTNLIYQKLKPDLENTWLDFHQVLTLASIVEKEGITPEDRRLIAGVFLNRLQVDMPLQSDITVLYVLGEHKEIVTYDDLEKDSPYNLYMYSGLGPGPFNSPSLEAIEAVLEPEWSNYYYFVADLDTQKVYYAETFEEHEVLVEKYVNKSQESQKESSSEEDASQGE